MPVHHDDFSIEDYISPVQASLRAGFTITFYIARCASLSVNKHLTKDDFEFNSQEVLDAARKLEWPDAELLHFLQFGFSDYSAHAPPVSWFSTRSVSIYKHWQVFTDNLQAEIDKNWMKGKCAFPPTTPFLVIPGADIPKPRRPNQFRFIWNTRTPGFYVLGSVIVNGEGTWLPVFTNFTADLPTYLAMSWFSIEQVREWSALLAVIAENACVPLRGRIREFSFWFRILVAACRDWWKCLPFFCVVLYRCPSPAGKSGQR